MTDDLLARARAEAEGHREVALREYLEWLYADEDDPAIKQLAETDTYVVRSVFKAGWDAHGAQLPDRKALVDAAQRGMAQYMREDIPEDGLSEAECIADAVLDLIRGGNRESGNSGRKDER